MQCIKDASRQIGKASFFIILFYYNINVYVISASPYSLFILVVVPSFLRILVPIHFKKHIRGMKRSVVSYKTIFFIFLTLLFIPARLYCQIRIFIHIFSSHIVRFHALVIQRTSRLYKKDNIVFNKPILCNIDSYISDIVPCLFL